MLLRGLGQHVRGDGDRLLGAARLRVLGGLQDLRPVPVQPHRVGTERAAGLARGGGALHPVIAVGVVAGEAAGLVAGGLGGPRVVLRGLRRGGGAGQRGEFQQAHVVGTKHRGGPHGGLPGFPAALMPG